MDTSILEEPFIQNIEASDPYQTLVFTKLQSATSPMTMYRICACVFYFATLFQLAACYDAKGEEKEDMIV
jgi:hypothetical protein